MIRIGGQTILPGKLRALALGSQAAGDIDKIRIVENLAVGGKDGRLGGIGLVEPQSRAAPRLSDPEIRRRRP